MLGEKKVDIRSGADFIIAPMDKYTVQISDVNPKTVFSKYSGKEEEVFNFEFVILDDKPILDPETGESTGTTRGIRFTQLINPTLGKKAMLLDLAKAVLGREPTDEERDNDSPSRLNPDNWVGKQVIAMVTEKPNSDNTGVFNKATTFSRTVKKLEDWFEDQRRDQVVVESKTQPAVAKNESSDAEADKFLGDLDGDDPIDFNDLGVDKDTKEESVEELEAKFKAAKENTKK
jgi:hypothetical protein